MLQPPTQQPTPLSPTTTPEQDDRDRQQRGTGFTNISRILGANQGAGKTMGEAIGSGIDKQAQDVKSGIEAGKSQFQAGSQTAQQNANNVIQQGQSLVKAGTDKDDNAYAARIAAGVDAQGNAIDFAKTGQDLKNVSYNGPTGLANSSQIQSQAATAGALARMAGSAGGQGQLLKSMVAQRGNYTGGQNALDQLLIGKEGQNAIQQGRRSAAGIVQNATNAVGNAETQATATAGAIADKRANTLSAIQGQLGDDNGGFMGTAKQQATQFNTDAGKLSQLLSGQWVPKDSDEKAQAEALVNRMGDFGLNNYNLYDKDDNALKNAVASLQGSTSNGTYKYTDDQAKAAQNLAAFLGQNDIQKQIADNKFNTNAFTNESDVFNPLDTARNKDIKNRDMLTQDAAAFKASEDRKKAAYQQYMVSTGDPLADGIRASMANGILNGADQQLLDKYGYNAWADVNPDTDTRLQGTNNPWAGLGLAPTGPGGTMRTSASLLDAANKQVGSDVSLKDYVLRKMLGIDPGGVEAQGVNDGTFKPTLKG